MKQVIKHPFRVRKSGWTNANGTHKYYVINEETGELWRTFDSRRDAYEFAYYSNGNIGEYSRALWY